MFGAWPELVRVCIALLLSGATVKFMDDVMDMEYDLARGKRTLAARLGRASLPYSLVAFAIAMIAQPLVSSSVFFASYAVGMFSRSTERLPTHVRAYIEIVVAVSLTVFITGWRDALWGISMMCLIDWLDDVMDRRRDNETGQFNVAIRFGTVETLFAILIVFCFALYAKLGWTIAALVTWSVLDMIFQSTTERVRNEDERADIL